MVCIMLVSMMTEVNVPDLTHCFNYTVTPQLLITAKFKNIDISIHMYRFNLLSSNNHKQEAFLC